MNVSEPQIEQSKHHVHTGLFFIIGLLVVICLCVAVLFFVKERALTDVINSTTEEKVKLQERVDILEEDTYRGPYGVLSHVKYAQANTVPSLAFYSQIAQYPKASCDVLWSVDTNAPFLSHVFSFSALLSSHPLQALSESNKKELEQSIKTQLSYLSSDAKERLPMYILKTGCFVNDHQVLFIGADVGNIFRIPIWAERVDGTWALKNFSTIPSSYSAPPEELYIHSDGRPMLIDQYQDGELFLGWVAYYLDTQNKVLDTIEMCRVTKQEEQYLRLCSRLYDEGE